MNQQATKSNQLLFSFGKNWHNYVNNFLGRKQLDVARDSLLKYLPEEEYKNKVFIDIGCGSGIFSLGALRLGCKKVISFDADEYSIKAANLVKDKFSELIPEGAQWEIFEGSILDDKLVHTMEAQGDIVYSWGVLHHTGSMYQAIRNAARLVKSEGHFILAIYNKSPYSDFWIRVKKIYNKSPRIIRGFMVCGTIAINVVSSILSKVEIFLVGKKNKEKQYDNSYRGMSNYHNIVDWLGGYPFEDASFEEINSFVNLLGFELIGAPITCSSPSKNEYKRSVKLIHKIAYPYSYFGTYTGNNEFVFRKKRS